MKGLYIYKIHFTEANPEVFKGKKYWKGYRTFEDASRQAYKIFQQTKITEIQIIRYMRDPNYSVLLKK